MKGAIIGDIVGSVYEWDNIKTKDFPLFREDCFFTDDTVMTVAVGEALINCLTRYKRPCLTPSPLQILTWTMQYYGRRYPDRGYGGRFLDWIYDADPQPYNSWGNGAPMRCSAAGWLATHMDGAEALGALTALPTHNHPEGIRAAALTAELIYLARTRRNMDALWTIAEEAYNIPKLDDVRDTYTFTESSQGTMPVALAAFFESTSFEDAIRNAISVGGDSDTIAAITGSIAEAYYGVPDELWDKAATYLDDHLLACVNRFYDYIKESNQPILQGGSQMINYTITCNCYDPMIRDNIQIKADTLDEAWSKAVKKFCRKHKAKPSNVVITAVCRS